jgi:transposase-like protein
MTCLRCKHHEAKRFEFYGRKRIQRYRCPGCNATFSEPRKLGRELSKWIAIHIRSPPSSNTHLEHHPPHPIDETRDFRSILSSVCIW